MQDFWHWLVVGFAFGVGFRLAEYALAGLLGLVGRGAARGGP